MRKTGGGTGGNARQRTPLATRLVNAAGPTGVAVVFAVQRLVDPKWGESAGPPWVVWGLIGVCAVVGILNWIDVVRAIRASRRR